MMLRGGGVARMSGSSRYQDTITTYSILKMWVPCTRRSSWQPGSGAPRIALLRNSDVDRDKHPPPVQMRVVNVQLVRCRERRYLRLCALPAATRTVSKKVISEPLPVY